MPGLVSIVDVSRCNGEGLAPKSDVLFLQKSQNGVRQVPTRHILLSSILAKRRMLNHFSEIGYGNCGGNQACTKTTRLY